MLDRYPELATELREFFADQERIACLVVRYRNYRKRSFGNWATSASSARWAGAAWAWCTRRSRCRLRRRVALKVLPFAATMDPRHLRRFQNEAQAAACLHHTNIVPVYFVGCERGVHFYAMQFIDGQPLSELIRQMAQGADAGGGADHGLSDAAG